MVGIVSPAFSLKGWNPWIYLSKNKESIKLIAAAIGTISFLGFTLEGAVVTIVVKAVLDIADYYVSAVKA